MTHLADALYRLMLRALPASLRRQFGDDLVQMFATIVAGARPAHPSGAPLGRRRSRHPRLRPRRGVATTKGPACSAPSSSTCATGCACCAGIPRCRRSRCSRSPLASARTPRCSRSSTPCCCARCRIPNPDRLVMAWETRKAEGVATDGSSPADFLDWRLAHARVRVDGGGGLGFRHAHRRRGPRGARRRDGVRGEISTCWASRRNAVAQGPVARRARRLVPRRHPQPPRVGDSGLAPTPPSSAATSSSTAVRFA